MNEYNKGTYIPCPSCKSAIFEGEACKKCLKIKRARLLKQIREKKYKNVKIHELKTS